MPPVVIITGASRGIGAATAEWLTKAGANTVLIGRRRESLLQTENEIKLMGGRTLSLAIDIANSTDCQKSIQQCLDQFGQLDALINNAGIVEPLATIADSDPAEWRYNIEVNLVGAYYLSKAAIPALRQQRGRIINVSSGAGNHAIQAASAYCAAKAALTHFTRVLAAEEPLLTAIAVRPGVVDTQMQTTIRCEGSKTMPPDQIAYYQNLKYENELAPPSVPALSIAWLALRSPSAWSGRFVNYDDPDIINSAKISV